jgi:hypothetical protein
MCGEGAQTEALAHIPSFIRDVMKVVVLTSVTIISVHQWPCAGGCQHRIRFERSIATAEVLCSALDYRDLF